MLFFLKILRKNIYLKYGRVWWVRRAGGLHGVLEEVVVALPRRRVREAHRRRAAAVPEAVEVRLPDLAAPALLLSQQQEGWKEKRMNSIIMIDFIARWFLPNHFPSMYSF